MHGALVCGACRPDTVVRVRDSAYVLDYIQAFYYTAETDVMPWILKNKVWHSPGRVVCAVWVVCERVCVMVCVLLCWCVSVCECAWGCVFVSVCVCLCVCICARALCAWV
jgi:hypothetical protein